MIWLTILLSFLLAFAAALASSFLTLAWRRRRKASESAIGFELLLPGHDCGFCGYESCRDYAEALDAGRADPALCSPGGSILERSLRGLIAESRKADPRALARRAVVRCCASKGVARLAFDYDNREDCATAASLYGGPLRCKEGCLGFGSCLAACPIGAIRIKAGLAVVDPLLCTGCGDCLDSCPKGLIALLPAEEAWYVACSASGERELRRESCASACDACGACVRLSAVGQFSIVEGLARASRVDEASGAEIARSCPSGTIRPVFPAQDAQAEREERANRAKKNADPPSGRPASGL